MAASMQGMMALMLEPLLGKQVTWQASHLASKSLASKSLASKSLGKQARHCYGETQSAPLRAHQPGASEHPGKKPKDIR
jgi:hypothetical protein